MMVEGDSLLITLIRGILGCISQIHSIREALSKYPRGLSYQKKFTVNIYLCILYELALCYNYKRFRLVELELGRGRT